MGFEETRKKNLKEILETENNGDVWAQTCFMKLIHAK